MHRRRIGNAPMRRHRLTGPDRTDFVGRVVTDGKNEIQFGSTRLREFIPTLASQSLGWDTRGFEAIDRLRPHRAGWMTSCAVGAKPGFAGEVKNRLGHDRARRVPGAEKENVVMHGVRSWHLAVSIWPNERLEGQMPSAKCSE